MINLFSEKLLLPPPEDRPHVLSHHEEVETSEALPHEQVPRGSRL